MPVTAEQATTELRRRRAIEELARRKQPDVPGPLGDIAFIPKEPEGVWAYDKQLDDLFSGETNLEDLLPLDVRYDFGKIIGMTSKPDETRAKMVNSLYYSIQLGIPPKITFNITDELNKIWFGKEKLPLQPGKLFAQSFIQSMADKPAMMLKGLEVYTPGTGKVDKLLEKSATFLQSLKDPGTAEKLQQARAGKLWPIAKNAQWYQVQAKYLPEVINAWATNVGDQIPIMLTTYAGRMMGRVVGEPIGAATAAAWALATGGIDPTDVATAPLVKTISSKIIEHLGGAVPLVAMEAGYFMDEANALGIDKDISEKYAKMYGLGSGAIEYAQWLWVLGRYKAITKSAQKTIMRQTLSHIGGSAFEGLEEISQEGLQNWLLQKAVKEMKERNPDYIGVAPKTWEGWKRSGAIGAGVAAITGMPGTALTMAQGRVARREIIKPETKMPEVVEIPVKPPAEVVPEVVEKPPEALPVAKVPAEAVEVPTKPVAKPEVKVKEISPIVEPELTKAEEVDIARLEAEIEVPFEMVRVKDVGFVIKEKATGKEVAVIAKRKKAKVKLAEFIRGEKKIRETRRKPKLLTEKATIGKLITEARALKAAMKKAAQAARKAYQIGKAEGIAKVKAYYYDIRQREQVRKQLKKRTQKAIKIITKETPATVDFHYREAIENLKIGIDPSLRTEKTLRMREKTREYLARKPEALKDMPVKLLKKLEKKSIGEYTIEEVEQIADEIERLTKQGKLKRSLYLKQKARKIEKTTQDITETVSKGKKIEFETEPITYETTKDGLIQSGFEKFKAWTWRPSRIFDMLDGGKATFSGEAHRTFIDQVNQATDKKLRQVDKRRDGGIAKMKELGIAFSDLAQTREIAGVRYMVGEMIGIYCANKNRLGKLAIMYGNNLSQETINEVIVNLTEAEKAWGDYIIQDYENRYDVLREKVVEVENRDMGYEENYTPIRRAEVDYTTHTEEIIDAILQKEHLRRVYAEHGFTIHRKDVPAEFQKPIRLNVTSVWLGQINKQEQYIHFAELIRDLHKIVADKEFRAAVEQQFGKEFNKVIKNYIDRVANPNIYKSYNALENTSRRLRQSAVIAYLSYNLVTMAKQVPSLFLYLQDAGPTHLISSAMEFATHPVEMIKMVREKDPQVKHRAIERELEEMKSRNPEMYSRIINKFSRSGMQGIYAFDAVARTIGWNAVYQKALKCDKSEVEAVRLAQTATLRTQPAAASKDVAQLYATNEFANWFTMFTNQLNQIYNIATYDMSGYIKNAKYAEASLAFTGLSLTALFIWIITKRRLPEDKEDWIDVASEQAINAIPLVGKAIIAGKRGWGDTELPAFELPKAAGRASDKIVKWEFTDSDLKAIAEGIAVTVGIPYTGPKRVIKMIDTGELKELIGGEPIEKKRKKRRLVPGKR